MSDTRWLRYVQEAERANVARLCFGESIPEHLPDFPTVTLPRKALVNIRVELSTLRNVVCALLELNPETATVGSVLRVMAEREWVESRKGNPNGS